MKRIILAQPRGFCAGVHRAVDIVERAIEKFGAPIYVRHEIVHNKHVVDRLTNKGAIFVDEILDIPKKSNISSTKIAPLFVNLSTTCLL
jgi:4-hydroxy-3-methylbut-2-enyl diphosphate reductase